MKKNIIKKIKNKKFIFKIIITLIILIIFTYALVLFLNGTKVFIDDEEYWYSYFHYPTDSIYNRSIPLWNPYMNGGEPYWPTLGIWRFIDPINLLILIIGKIFCISIFQLYHISFIIKITVSIFGLYFLLRKLTGFFLVAVFLTIFFAYIHFSILFTQLYYGMFCWVPYILLFFIKFIEKRNIKDFLFIIYFLGIYIGAGSYPTSYGLFFIILFIILTIILNPKKVFTKLGVFIRNNKIYIIISILFIIIICLPIISTIIGLNELYPVARTCINRDTFENVNSFTNPTYEDLFKEGVVGTFTILIDTIGLSRIPLSQVETTSYKYYILKNIFLTINLIIALFAFIGIIFGKSKWKLHFSIISILVIFAFLGPRTPIYKIYFYLFYPLRALRYTHLFQIFILLCYIFFAGLGLKFIIENFRSNKTIIYSIFTITMILLIAISVGKPFYVNSANRNDYYPDFSHYSQEFKFIDKRIFAIPRTGFYLQEPILYRQNTALQMLAAPPDDMEPEELQYYKEWNSIKAPNRFDACYGLRTLYWTKNYYKIYRLGEEDIDIFNLLMGVNQNIIDFKKNILVMNDNQTEKLINEIKSEEFKKIIFNSIIIENQPNTYLFKEFNIIYKNSINNLENNNTKLNYKILSYKPAKIVMIVNVNQNGMMIFRDGFNHQWKAYVDGIEKEIYRANIGSKGIFLNEGEHLVTFIYLPLFYLIAFYSYIILSFITPFLIIFLIKKKASNTEKNKSH